MNKNLSPIEQLYSRIFRGFTEIEHSYAALADIAVYMRRFPSNLGEIPKVRYLDYHIDNFLNEVYILQERLKTYIKTVTRSYRKDNRLKAMTAQLDSLSKHLFSFSNILAIRGSHVHVVRHTDDDLERLSLLELLSTHGEPGMSRLLFQSHLRETRKKWIKLINDSVEEMKKILDEYFSVLREVIFDDEGEMIVPFKSKK